MRSCRSSSWFCHSCFNAKNIQKQVKVEKTIIKHPFGNGSHHLFMMIWGMVYIIVLPLLNADFMKLRLQVSTPLFFFKQPAQVSARETATPPVLGGVGWGKVDRCSGFPPPDRETRAGAHRRFWFPQGGFLNSTSDCTSSLLDLLNRRHEPCAAQSFKELFSDRCITWGPKSRSLSPVVQGAIRPSPLKIQSYSTKMKNQIWCLISWHIKVYN